MEELNPILKAYRKSETLPTKFSMNELVGMLNGINVGVSKGMPASGVAMLGDKILLEGRADAGTNEFNVANKRAVALYEAISQEFSSRGVATPIGATYAAAVLDKEAVANRLGIPFELAWNGTGKKGDADGQRHSARASKMSGAIDDPRNANLKDLIARGIAGELTPTEQATQISWDIIRANAAGIDRDTPITREGVYTKQIKEGMNTTIDNTIKDLKLSYPRAVAVREDLSNASDVLNLLPVLWQRAAGLKTEATPELSKMVPDSINVLNSILGIK
jgi:hypothetical protein